MGREARARQAAKRIYVAAPWWRRLLMRLGVL